MMIRTSKALIKLNESGCMSIQLGVDRLSTSCEAECSERARVRQPNEYSYILIQPDEVDWLLTL